MRPTGSCAWSGWATISTVTTWPDLASPALLGRNQDVLVDAAVFRHHEADAVLVVVAADDERVGVLQHLDDLAFAPAALVEAGVAAPAPGRRAAPGAFPWATGTEIVAAVVRHDEAEAIRMAFDAAPDQVQLVRQAELALAVEHDLAVALHRVQAALKQVALVSVDVQQAREGRRHRPGSPARSAAAGCIRGWAAAIRSVRFALAERVGQTDRGDLVFACAAAGFFSRLLR